jgi:hypothetical protein
VEIDVRSWRDWGEEVGCDWVQKFVECHRNMPRNMPRVLEHGGHLGLFAKRVSAR